MRTFPVKDAEGRLVAFEVPNAYVGVASIARLLTSADGVAEVKRRHPFSPGDVHVRFKHNGVACIVWEPYGDNSRYWIGPEAGVSEGHDFAGVHGVFRRYRPPLLRRLLGHALYAFSLEWLAERNQ